MFLHREQLLAEQLLVDGERSTSWPLRDALERSVLMQKSANRVEGKVQAIKAKLTS